MTLPWKPIVGGLSVLLAGLAAWAVSGTTGLEPDHPSPPPRLSESPTDAFIVEVAPRTAAIDQPVRIQIRGLHKGEHIVLRARTEDAEGTLFRSWAGFVADNEGRADLSTQAPVEGTYSGVEPSGLLWSMSADDGRSFVTSMAWHQREIELTVDTTRGSKSVTLVRRYPWKATTREEISAPKLEAVLTLPNALPNLSAMPVIVLLSGWGDGPAPLKAAMLAARGYAVLNVGYHHWPRTPERLVEIPVETVFKALEWIAADARLDETRVGIYGTSKGAELALLAACHSPSFRAVAAWVPPSVVFAGTDFSDMDPGSSWTLQGRPVPYTTLRPGLSELRNALRFALGRPMILEPTYTKALDSAPEGAKLPVERITAPILLVSGTDDRMWPSGRMANQLAERIAASGGTGKLTNLVFEGAGHGITPGLWPTGGRRSVMFWRGGSPTADHRAGQVAWATMLEFFESHLK